jgi:hypothetical protein
MKHYIVALDNNNNQVELGVSNEIAEIQIKTDEEVVESFMVDNTIQFAIGKALALEKYLNRV